MKQTVHFNKTEKLPDGSWACTIAPKGIQLDDNGQAIFVPKYQDRIYDREMEAELLTGAKSTNRSIIIHLMPKIGIPTVGRAYTIERK